MLDIVITHYNEPWRLCRKLFVMLDMQRIVNWDEITVWVINDGGYQLPKEELDKLSFHVFQIDIPKSGVSAARNIGFELGNEPWVMFCDCDDAFTNIYALDELMSEIRKQSSEQYDMMYAKCLTEFGRIVVPIADERQLVFIHSKLYRRQFLVEEKLLFDESVTYGEDTLFNDTLLTKTNRIKEIETRSHSYVWIRRGGSVTTSGSHEEYKSPSFPADCRSRPAGIGLGLHSQVGGEDVP